MKGFLFICTSHEAFGFCTICDSLMPCTVQFCRKKKWIYNGIFQVGACPNLKDSLISEYFSLHTYKTYRVRYHHFCAICDSLMLCKVHYFGKRWFFHEIFQVGACMPQLERSFFIWQVFYPHVQGMKHSVFSTFFLCLRLPYAQEGTFFGKRWIFNGIFQVGACPNLKDSLIYENLSIHMYKT